VFPYGSAVIPKAMQRRRWSLALICAMALLSAGQGLAQTRTITVGEGDTLEQLALRHGVDLDTLIAINGISDPTLLQVGQVLNLPAAAPVASRSSSGAIAPPPPDGTGGEAAAALLLSPAEPSTGRAGNSIQAVCGSPW
jgi:hypothetical protein